MGLFKTVLLGNQMSAGGCCILGLALRMGSGKASNAAHDSLVPTACVRPLCNLYVIPLTRVSILYMEKLRLRELMWLTYGARVRNQVPGHQV